MALFRYKAVAAGGELVQGDMEAGCRDEVVARLRAQGHLPIRAQAVSGPRRRFQLSGGGSPRDLALATRELATLLGAGLPLDRSLEIMISTGGARMGCWQRVLARIRDGAPLADAMAAQPDRFPAHYVSMIKAGEAGGALDAVLLRLADFLERAQSLRETIRSALVYPVLLTLMMGATVVLLLVVVLPRFQALFEEANAVLPPAVRTVLWTGEFLQAWWWALLAGLLAAPLLFRTWAARPANRLLWDRGLLRLPLFGSLVAKTETARFGRVMATLLGNGVAMPQALAIARDTAGNAWIAHGLDEVAGALKQGRGLGVPLAERRLLTPLGLQLLHVGEETGSLEAMLAKLSDIHEEETRRTIQRLLALLVPVLTVVMGLMVAAIIGTILSATLGIYDLPV